ncbi:hypothetical protein ILUMI_14076, partial [Ignelater luminosus]
TLKGILAKIQFDTDINSGILDHLKKQVIKMKPADRYCSLIFDEMSRSSGFHYEQVKQYISGFEGIGALGRTNKAANHGLANDNQISHVHFESNQRCRWFNYLGFRGINRDSLENLFASVRLHGAANTNPTCHHFTAALRTVVVNKLVSPTNVDSNCKNDTCTPLDFFVGLMRHASNDDSQEVEKQFPESEMLTDFNIS